MSMLKAKISYAMSTDDMAFGQEVKVSCSKSKKQENWQGWDQGMHIPSALRHMQHSPSFKVLYTQRDSLYSLVSHSCDAQRTEETHKHTSIHS